MTDTDCPRDQLGVMLAGGKPGLRWRYPDALRGPGSRSPRDVGGSAIEQRERANAIEAEFVPIRVAVFEA
jgi:hypothetical protein